MHPNSVKQNNSEVLEEALWFVRVRSDPAAAANYVHVVLLGESLGEPKSNMR